MLSAFTARPIVELKQRDKSRIESILAYGDRLLVGLNTGVLRIYRINEYYEEPEPSSSTEATEDADDAAAKPKQRPADLLREVEKFSRRPVQQLAIIKEANILVSLSDNYVSIHDLQTYELQERLEKTKGATCFAVISNIVKDPETGIPSIVSRLAVAVKRRIILWSWQDMELSNETAELTLIAAVKSLSWATGTKIVAGMDPGFVMVDIESEEVADIVKPGALSDANGQQGARFGAVGSSGMGYMGMGSWVPKPMATKLGDGEMLLAKDVNSLFIDTDGKALDKRQIPWTSAPEAIGYSYPYMLALQHPSKGALEVRNPDTLNLLQIVHIPNASFMHVPQPNISLAHAGKGFLVASDRCVWRMGALHYEAQIDALVAQNRFDEAVSLLNMLEDTLLKDKQGRIRDVQIRKARNLFEQRRYRDAMDLFSDAVAPPEKVIALYPKLIAGEFSAIEESESEAESDEEGGKTDEETAAAEKNATNANSLTRAMFGRLVPEQKKDSDTASVRSVKIDSDVASVRGKKVHDRHADGQDKPLQGKDLTLAVTALFGFLAQTRAQLQKFINYDGTLKTPLPPKEEQPEDYRPPFAPFILLPEDPKEEIDWAGRLHKVARVTDTTLFRAYMFARPGMAGPLFRLDNFCEPSVVREKLYESGRYTDLIDFLHGKKMHHEALEILQKFGKGEAEEEAPVALQGPERTILYLQQLPPDLIDLILEYAEWPIREDPENGMEIFLADTENAETLPRDRVLQFLSKIDHDLAIRYLEHIIYELNDQTPDFHSMLIDEYLDHLKRKEPDGSNAEEYYRKWQEKVESFLRSSNQYNKARVFRALPQDEPHFFEARAIVLSKMGQHKQALQIYVFQIKDYEKAEDYCNQVYLSSATTATKTRRASTKSNAFLHQDPEHAEPSIYHTLLSLYLTPPPPHTPNFEPALSLLSKHGARLPASSTLDLIPPTLPIADLESYFRGRMRSANTVRNSERIVAQLRAVEKLSVEKDLLLGAGSVDRVGGRNRRVVVGEDRHCSVCGKRFGGSAIRVYPDDVVVHYGCFTRGMQAVGSPQASSWGTARAAAGVASSASPDGWTGLGAGMAALRRGKSPTPTSPEPKVGVQRWDTWAG
ncbi:vacuolar sorting protein 39 domain 2-domain-containing protein [Phyllosticta capitalensis]|uniref:Vacuolar sorting protein 39 domain 2-domain-containing protein n=1 Tax=Phyllosticta capitalensis TaxID=121624 RepID=A0ABR1Z4V6_9PEZI